MKHILTSALLALLLALGAGRAGAQTDLTGRVYHNANIMAAAMNEATKDMDRQLVEAKKQAIAEAEQKKGRKLSADELAEIDKKVAEASKLAEAMKTGMKVGITVEFKTNTDVVMKNDMKINDEVLKAAGISWMKRKALKAALALAPSTEKGTYVVNGNLVIVDDGKDKDTLHLVNNGQQLQGYFDKGTKFTLTRIKKD